MEERQQLQEEEMSNESKKTTIVIPSFQSIPHGEASNGGSNANSNSSFAQAFSFIKSSEFYSPPPPSEPLEREARNVGLVSENSTTGAFSASTCGNNRNSIIVSHRQKGNPLLKHIRNVKWVFADVVCDYLLGQNSCALYLSLRYHLLHPDYLYFRIRELQKKFKLRVVLCHVDVEDVVKPLQDVTRTALLHDCTLLCGWSFEECGRYLETIKVYENKSADTIREQMDNDYLSRLNHTLTTVRHVNKTNVITLGSTFGSLSRVMDASMEELARCPGIGERKVKRLHDTFHEPFKRVSRQRTLIPDASEDKNRDMPCQLNDELKEDEAASSVTGSESTDSVKSALAAAFAKYKNKVNKKKGKEQVQGSYAA